MPRKRTRSLLTPDGYPQKLVEVGGSMVEIVCPTCQTPFLRRGSRAHTQAGLGKTQYCSTSCRSKAVSGRPEHRELSRRNMTATQRKREQGGMRAWNYGRPWSETHRATMSEVRKNKPFPGKRGGNGTGMANTEALIAPLLPEGFRWNHIVSLKGAGAGYPSHYKLDFADASRMVCLEVDGQSHGTYLGMARDRKKTEKLQSLGWTVFRIKNTEAWSLYSTLRLKEHLHTLLTGSSSITAPN